MDLLPMHYFIMSYVGHLENNGSPSYGYLPNADTFHFELSKLIFINIATDLIREVIKN